MSLDEGLDPSTVNYIRSLWIAEDFDEYFAFNPLFQFDLEFVGRMLPRPQRVLDLGCGTGRHLMTLARQGFDVTGVDLSDNMLRIVREKLDAESLAAKLIKANICHMPELGDQSFDAALCMFSTLGMVRGRKHRQRCLDEVHRLLRPGGLFLCHFHNFYFEGWRPEIWLKWIDSIGLWLTGGHELGDRRLDNYRNIENMFIHIFRPGEIRRSLARSGFRLEYLVHLNSDRSRELGQVLLRTMRANGFICVARRPETGISV